MKMLLLCFATLAWLSGCATVPEDTAVAAAETEYPTGSNIPRKKSSAKQETMTVEQAADMRRAVEAQRVGRQ